jgi:alkylation response protein AidB-like acyl-CoA dehydrogenase
LTLGKAVAKLGMRTAPLCDLYFDDCEIPETQLLGEVGLGFPILDFVMKWEILMSFAVSLGEMHHRLELCIEYAKTRTQFGQAIGKFQSVANKLVDMRIGLEVSRSTLYRTAERVQKGENASMDVALTKLLVSEHNLASALHAVQIFGGHGYMSEVGLELDLRNAVGGTLYSGTSEVQRDRIAKLMGL